MGNHQGRNQPWRAGSGLLALPPPPRRLQPDIPLQPPTLQADPIQATAPGYRRGPEVGGPGGLGGPESPGHSGLTPSAPSPVPEEIPGPCRLLVSDEWRDLNFDTMVMQDSCP